MEVYRSEISTITISLPEGYVQPASYEIFRDDESIAIGSPTSSTSGSITLQLPFAAVTRDGDLEVKVTFTIEGQTYTKSEYIRVVTPIAPISSFKTEFSDTNLTDSDLAEIEKRVRSVVNSYTQQRFGYFSGTRYVVGAGESSLLLPERLIRLTGVSSGGVPYTSGYSITGDGWYLAAGMDADLTIKMAPPEEAVYVSAGVIRVPEWYATKFKNNVAYAVTGEWGYLTVPEDVQQAALLLANDYAMSENVYRDRYVDVMKAADWNLEFNEGAFRGTGNVRADQLLDPYRRSRMVII